MRERSFPPSLHVSTVGQVGTRRLTSSLHDPDSAATVLNPGCQHDRKKEVPEGLTPQSMLQPGSDLCRFPCDLSARVSYMIAPTQETRKRQRPCAWRVGSWEETHSTADEQGGTMCLGDVYTAVLGRKDPLSYMLRSHWVHKAEFWGNGKGGER